MRFSPVPWNPPYTDRFRVVLDQVEADIKAGRTTQAEARDVIEAEVNRNRQELRKGELDLNRASRDEPSRKRDREEKKDRDDHDTHTPNEP